MTLEHTFISIQKFELILGNWGLGYLAALGYHRKINAN